MTFQVRLTDAGRAALADGSNRALRAIEIQSIEIGSSAGPGGAADDARTALRARIATLPATGVTTVPGRVIVTGEYRPSALVAVREVGLIARIGSAGSDFLLGFWTHPTTIVGRPEPGTVLSIAITLDIASASAAVTVTVNPEITVVTKPPAGVMAPFAGTAAPAGYLACDGSAVSRTTYAALYAAIGTTYGAGDGSTTFNLPDLERRAIVGAGGTATSVLGNTVGATGGSETHTLTTSEMPRHTHGISSEPSHTHGVGTYSAISAGSAHKHQVPVHMDAYDDDGPLTDRNVRLRDEGEYVDTRTDGAHSHTISGQSGSGGAHSHTAAASGGGGGHNNIPPSIVMLWIISTG